MQLEDQKPKYKWNNEIALFRTSCVNGKKSCHQIKKDKWTGWQQNLPAIGWAQVGMVEDKDCYQ